MRTVYAPVWCNRLTELLVVNLSLTSFVYVSTFLVFLI